MGEKKNRRKETHVPFFCCRCPTANLPVHRWIPEGKRKKGGKKKSVHLTWPVLPAGPPRVTVPAHRGGPPVQGGEKKGKERKKRKRGRRALFPYLPRRAVPSFSHPAGVPSEQPQRKERKKERRKKKKTSGTPPLLSEPSRASREGPIGMRGREAGKGSPH